MKKHETKVWLLIIDTNKYAGNFEREMCAAVTGQIGDCDVGEENAELFAKEHPDLEFGQDVLGMRDEHGCARPVVMYSKKGSTYNSVAIFFGRKLTAKEILFFTEQAKTFGAANNLKIKKVYTEQISYCEARDLAEL